MMLGVTTAIFPGQAATAAPDSTGDTLGVYVGTLDAAQFDKLKASGNDSHESTHHVPDAGKVGVETILATRRRSA